MRVFRKEFAASGIAPLIKGMAAYGAAELTVRVVRLVTVVIIARQLEPKIVGLAALTLTLFEIVRVFANIGVGQRIIAASEAELAPLCNTAHRIFWIWCSLVAAAQISIAAVLAFGFGQVTSGQMLAVLAMVYFWMPGGLVQCFLLMREGRAATTAATAATQTITDHLLTATLLVLWPSPWSIILPKLLTAPIWLLLTRRARPWSSKPSMGFAPVRQVFQFGLSVLATDVLLTMRSQLDKLIIAATLGVSALGTYFFAFNAGVGILSSLISAFGTVALPWLCAAPAGLTRRRKLYALILLGSAVFIPAALAQAVLAQWYVPIVFGRHWVSAVHLIAILCFAGIPLLLSTITTAWLRADARPGLDAKAGVVSCAASLGGLFIGTQMGGVEAAAAFWLAGLAIGILPFSGAILTWALRGDQRISTHEVLV
jgi:lipopolysaccharide exporter